MYTLEYTVSIDDLVAFNVYHADHSPSMRSARTRRWLLWGLVYLLLGALGFLLGNYVGGIVMTVFALLWVSLYPTYERWVHRRHFREILSEGDTKGLVGPRQLRADDEGLVETSHGRESKLAFSAVERIESTGLHAFIYHSNVEAIVIPRGPIASGNYDEFIRFIRDRHSNCQKLASRRAEEGAVFCRKCGRETAEHAAFCASCGVRLNEVEQRRGTRLSTAAGIISITDGSLKCAWVLCCVYFLVEMLVGGESLDVPRVLALTIIPAALGLLAIIGGIRAVQRKRLDLALAGAIAAIVPLFPLGIASVILLAKAKSKGVFERPQASERKP